MRFLWRLRTDTAAAVISPYFIRRAIGCCHDDRRLSLGAFSARASSPSARRTGVRFPLRCIRYTRLLPANGAHNLREISPLCERNGVLYCTRARYRCQTRRRRRAPVWKLLITRGRGKPEENGRVDRRFRFAHLLTYVNTEFRRAEDLLRGAVPDRVRHAA